MGNAAGYFGNPHYLVGKPACLYHVKGKTGSTATASSLSSLLLPASTGSFNRIVPIGMLEHVGMRHFDSYFASIARLLALNGVTPVYSIGDLHNTIRCNRWLNKYIFPGGYTPSHEQMTRATVRQGLKILDMEIMRGQHAYTL